MTITREQILEAARVGEGTDWEFKSAKGGLPGSLWETYSAMANSEGGTIVLGARESDVGAVVLDGLSNQQVQRYQKNLWDGLHDRHKVSVNLLATSDVYVEPVADGQLLVVRVPRAPRRARPVHLGPNPLGNTFRRQHEGDYRCTDDEVRRMLSDASEEARDSRVLEHFTFADLDPRTLDQYRRLFGLVNEGHPWLRLPDVEFLERLGGWRRERATGKHGPTLATLLMFGKELAIHDAEAAPNYLVDYRERLDPAMRWTDRIHPDGTWEANLFQFYGRVWPKVAHALPVPFRLEGVTRKDETPAHEALREAFVNAIVHADYAAGGGIVVERFPDRILLANPGNLLVSFEQYLRGGVSECRNPSLQKMFAMIGRGERAGSGVDKIKSGWRSQHWRSPQIRTQHQPDRVELTLPLVSLLQPATIEHMRHRFGAKLDLLSPAEVQALAIAEEEGIVSNRRLQDVSTEHRVDIGRMLQRLVEGGFLTSDNKRRWTTYRLIGEEARGQQQASLFELGSRGDSEHKAPDSEHKAGDSEHKASDSEHKAGDSEHKVGDSEHSAVAIPAGLAEEAAAVAGRGRVPSDLMRRTILALCRRRFLSAEDLGHLLGRHPNGLRQRFLTPMVTDGELRLRYPGSSNRPDQAYIATGSESEP
ncbi:MAG: ATP-binding protein [Planctomycetota bacterium]